VPPLQYAGRALAVTQVVPGTRLPLVGLTEIGLRSGVGQAAAGSRGTGWSSSPQPVAELQCGPIFWWPHVERWLKATARL